VECDTHLYRSTGGNNLKLVCYIPYDKRKGYRVSEALEAVQASLGAEVDYRPVKLTPDAPDLPDATEVVIEKPLVDNPPQSKFASMIREWCRLDFLETDADWLVFVDADCVVGEGFVNLLPDTEQIVTALYTARGNAAAYLAFNQKNGKTVPIQRPDLYANAETKRMQVGWSGMGATFIPRRALEQISWSEYELSPWPVETGEDGYFCLKAAKLGIPTYIDWSVPVRHYSEDGIGVWIDEELRGFMSKKKSGAEDSVKAVGVVYLGSSPIDHPILNRVYPGVFVPVEDEGLLKELAASGWFMIQDVVPEAKPKEADG